MKDAISGNVLFMIVIFFIVLFTGYLTLSINHSRAFDTNNTILRIIERRGVGKQSAEDLAEDPEFITEISEALNEAGYRTIGTCENGWVGFNATGDVDYGGNETVFCVNYVSSSNGSNNPSGHLHYFQVKTFYHFNIPIIRSVFHLDIKGDTKSMSDVMMKNY